MANIQDLAAQTGLSTATISRYLNRKPYVSKEAQLAIELAMERLDFHPNASARSLRSGRTGRVTVVVDRVDHTFYSALLAGVSHVALDHAYDILIQQNGARDWSPALLLEQAAARSMDGVIIASDGNARETLETLAGTLPAVACDQAVHDAPCPHVYVDHVQATLDGLAYLAERGARSIVCVYQSAGLCASDRFRRRGFEAFSRRDGAPQVRTVSAASDSIREGARLVATLAQMNPRPDAVFTGSDDLAAGMLAAARTAGIAVPAELAILGFDDQPIAEVFGLTTIRQPVQAMGRRAMKLLMGLIDGRYAAGAPARIQLPHELVRRETA